MSKKTHSLVLFLIFLVGIGSVLVFRLWQVKKAKSISFSPQPSTFTLEPPSEALKGKLLLTEGKVKKEPREKDEFEEVSLKEEILQGEKLVTGEKSQAIVEFPDFLRVDLDSNVEIGFINLIPANFLVSQSSGSVTYKLLQNDAPINVRSLHALLTINSGESEVTVKDEEVIIKILSGKTKLALVDLENETHIWKLEKGQQVLINDIERRVKIK